MRYNLTPEQEELSELVLPYRRIFFNPLRPGIDPDAPDEVKKAYARLKELTKERRQSCQEY